MEKKGDTQEREDERGGQGARRDGREREEMATSERQRETADDTFHG